MITLKRGVVAVAVFGLCACSKPEPINETHQGVIEDGDHTLSTDQSKYDEYSFRAAEGMQITLTMSSTAVDSYVHLIDKDGNQLVHDDDSGGGANGRDARVTFTAAYTGEYKAYANTAGAAERGAYSLVINTVAGH